MLTGEQTLRILSLRSYTLKMNLIKGVFCYNSAMIELKDITEALEASWASDTAFRSEDWSMENPARGQCVISSLIVQDYLGGELARCTAESDALQETHYFNLLPDGTVIDTTKNQYAHTVSLTPKPISFEGYTSIREKRLSDDSTRRRYELLKSRVESYLKGTRK